MYRFCFGFRIYVDAVVNHMSGTGRSGTGDGGSSYNSNGDNRDFPGVPYSAEHFTPRNQCPSGDGIAFTKSLNSVMHTI